MQSKALKAQKSPNTMMEKFTAPLIQLIWLQLAHLGLGETDVPAYHPSSGQLPPLPQMTPLAHFKAE